MESLTTGWYLLRTKSRQESKAQTHLEEQGFEVYGPTLWDKQHRAALFPGYLFLHLGGADDRRYHCLRNTPGVASDPMVRFGGRQRLPQPIPDDDTVMAEVRDLERRLNTPVRVSGSGFTAGDPVLLDNPLYRHYTATFQRKRGLDRGEVLVSYLQTRSLGRSTRSRLLGTKTLTVPLNQLRPCTVFDH